MLRLKLLLFFGLACVFASGQSLEVDTIAALPEVMIVGDRQEAFGQCSRQWTGGWEELPVFLKSYGPGQLTSLSLRGAGAGHTALIWNGFNLQNPMHGQVDFSLLPIPLFPEIRLDLGANAALWGSGSIGGAVHLHDNLNLVSPGHQLEISGRIGSFGRQVQQINWRWGDEHFHSQTRLFHIRQRNNYPYTGLQGAAMRQSHAGFRQLGGTQDLLFKKKGHQWDVHAWIQGSEREIPPTLLQSGSEASQGDQSIRLAVHWQYTQNKWALHLRSGFLRDVIDYRDPAANLDDWSASQVLIAEGEWHWAPGRSQLLAIGAHQSWLQGQTNYYEGIPRQQRQALFASYRVEDEKKKWLGIASIRQEWNEAHPAPLSPSISGAWKPLAWMQVQTQLSRHFRWPTLNDLYWAPGGNPDLQPEKGWGGELGVKGLGAWQNLPWEVGISAYSRRIEDWILWRPSGNFWSPQNLALVWSRGLEANGRIGLPIGPFRLNLSAAYSGIRSTSQKKQSPNDDSVGKQLVYTPLHTLSGRMGLKWKTLSFYWNQRFTGKAYTLADHSDSLPAYWLHDIHFEYQLNKNTFSLLIISNLNNISNTSYQTVQYRPMPGRNWELGIVLKEKWSK